MACKLCGGQMQKLGVLGIWEHLRYRECERMFNQFIGKKAVQKKKVLFSSHFDKSWCHPVFINTASKDCLEVFADLGFMKFPGTVLPDLIWFTNGEVGKHRKLSDHYLSRQKVVRNNPNVLTGVDDSTPFGGRDRIVFGNTTPIAQLVSVVHCIAVASSLQCIFRVF